MYLYQSKEKLTENFIEFILSTSEKHLTFNFFSFFRPKVSSSASAFVYASSQQPLLVAERSNSGLVTVDNGGCIRLWETGLAQLERSLDEWQKMVGTGV